MSQFTVIFSGNTTVGGMTNAINAVHPNDQHYFAPSTYVIDLVWSTNPSGIANLKAKIQSAIVGPGRVITVSHP